MQEAWVLSLGWEDPLEKEMETHFNIPFQKTPMNKGAWWATVHGGHKESDTTEDAHTTLPSFSFSHHEPLYMLFALCTWIYFFLCTWISFFFL